MNWITKGNYKFRRIWKAVPLSMVLACPELVVMIADNNAGGITTYSATSAKYAFFQITAKATRHLSTNFATRSGIVSDPHEV